MNYPWRAGRSCIFKNYIHLVFITKYRRNALTKEMLVRLKDVLTETAQQMQCNLLEFGGEDDHVHILLDLHPKHALSNIVSKLKGKSSYILKKEFYNLIKAKLWGKHFWSPSYCVVSTGDVSIDIVKKYIENQRTPPSAKQINQATKMTKIACLTRP
ncbi:MAG: IS200/IS605 family transposase [Rickettsia sp.]|nr:IS200/IS605 family transposase [Rickettsia sp.]